MSEVVGKGDSVDIRGYHAVVFDMDGVLLNSNDNKVVAMERALMEYQDEFNRAYIKNFQANFGKSRQYHFEVLYECFTNIDAETFKATIDNKFTHYSKKAYEESNLIDNVINLLEWLKRKDIRLFVATGSPEKVAREVLIQKGVGHYFESIYGSPASKENNLKKIKDVVNEGKILFIGDSLHDFNCAVSTKLDFLLFPTYSLNQREELVVRCRQRAYPFVDDFSELLAL